MGERRWDVVLDRDQRILLPETGPVPALERVIALDKAEHLLDRDITGRRSAERTPARAAACPQTPLPKMRAARKAIETWRSEL